MKIGALGGIAFNVSEKHVETITNYSQTSQGNYSVHDIHNGIGKTEYTGAKPDNITFDIGLSQLLGANVNKDYQLLRKYSRYGYAVTLVIGSQIYMKVAVLSAKNKAETHAQNGDIIAMTVSVSLQEYV